MKGLKIEFKFPRQLRVKINYDGKKKKATLWYTGNMKPNYISSTFGLEDFQVYDNY